MVITDEHKKVLYYMNNESCFFYNALEKWTGLTRKRLIEIMLELKIAGYCTLENVVNDDWMFCGRCHILTRKGDDLKEELKIETYREPELYY